MIQQQCPYCKARYEFPELKAGSGFVCLECGQEFIIGTLADAVPQQRRGMPEWLQWLLGTVCALVLATIGTAAFIWYLQQTSSSAERKESVVSQDPLSAAFQNARQWIDANDPVRLSAALRDFDVNAQDQDGLPLLRYAARSGKRELVQVLLSAGARINQLGQDGETVFHEAARNQDLAMVEFLFKNGGDCNVAGYGVGAPLGLAAEQGDFAMVSYLLAAAELPPEYNVPEKAIFRAIRGGKRDCVRELLPKYAVTTTDQSGNTILMALLAVGDEELAREALSLGADLNALNQEQVSGYFLAVRGNHQEVLKLFPLDSVDLGQTDASGISLPMLCARNGNATLFLALTTDANRQLQDKAGRDVLYYACLGQNWTIMNTLLEKQPRLQYPNLVSSPVYAAYLSGNAAILEVLLGVGFSLEGKDPDGNTLLMLAAASGNSAIVKLAIEFGLSCLECNAAGQNAFTLAVENQRQEIVNYLRPVLFRQQTESVRKLIFDLRQTPDMSYVDAEAKLTEWATQVADNPEAQELLKQARAEVESAEVKRATEALAQALMEAQKNQDIAQAVRHLEVVLVQEPKAGNREQAQELLTRLKRQQELEDQREAEAEAQRARYARMSQGELKSEIQTFVDSWLEEMKLRNPTSSYWMAGGDVTTLYSVRSWEILGNKGGSPYSSSVNTLMIQVESSTKGGFPIRQTWQVKILREDSGKWKILDMTE